MTDLLVMLGAIMPEDMIIDHIEKAIADYKADPTKEKRSNLVMHCVLLRNKEREKELVEAFNELFEWVKGMEMHHEELEYIESIRRRIK